MIFLHDNYQHNLTSQAAIGIWAWSLLCRKTIRLTPICFAASNAVKRTIFLHNSYHSTSKSKRPNFCLLQFQTSY